MSAAILLQDWVTVRGSTSGTVVTQPVSGYADLAPYQDVVAFLEVSDVSGTPAMKFETAPTDDDNLFQNMDGSTFAPSVGVTTKIYRYSAATVPLARFMRWKVPSAAGAWSLTFRVWLSPNLG